MFELPGSMASELTAMLAVRSVNGVHDTPVFVVFQTPPATPAAYIVLGVLGLITIALVRPPMLPGPRWVHEPKNSGSTKLVLAISASEGSMASCGVECRGIRLAFRISRKYRSAEIGIFPSGDRF